MKNTYETKNKTQFTYEAQAKVSFWGFWSDIPSFLILAVSAFVTFSPLVWINFLDSLCFILQSSLVFFISRKLQKNTWFEYNYGTKRMEAITALICDMLLSIGTVCVVILSVYELLHPVTPSSFLWYAVLSKIIDVTIDVLLYWNQVKIFKKNHSAIIKTEYYGSLKDLAFDSLSLVLIGVCYFCRDHLITSYFSSITALIICLIYLISRTKDIKRGFSDLTDKTLEEKYQFIILKVLNQYDSQYSTFYAVDSHQLAEQLFVDFHLGFAPETTFAEITALNYLLEQDLQNLLGNCKVSIVIDKLQQEKG